MKTTKQKLQHVIRLLEKGWCKRALARDKNGDIVAALSPKAKCFCMSGALARAGITEYRNQLNLIVPFLPKNTHPSIYYYNDYVAVNRRGPISVIKKTLKSL